MREYYTIPVNPRLCEEFIYIACILWKKPAVTHLMYFFLLVFKHVNFRHLTSPGTEAEIACPVGTFNPDLGLKVVTECRPCTAGKYCREKSVTETGPCDAGFYCPTNITNGVSSLRIGSFGPNQVPCPKASFQNETGARTEADCYACPVGYYCPEGTVNPIICPLGYYCPPDSGDPQPCPVGHFNNRSGIHFVENCTACTPGW